jgi:polyferredoxin
MLNLVPLLIGTGVGLALHFTVGWWGFLVVFPWIGLAVSIGIAMTRTLPPARKGLGRRVGITLAAPALLLFVPLTNHENFQLEGVLMIVMVGYFSKGFIHYAVAKLAGPLIWGRGFCGWACWTAAALEWLPVRKGSQPIGTGPRRLRYASLLVSIAIPAVLVFAYHYDVRGAYIGRAEVGWMFAGNAVYYLLAVPLAFLMSDRRAFCKVLCPVSLVMKVPTRFALLRKRPSGAGCTECGACTRACPMDVDVMGYISAGRAVADTECIYCNSCKQRCPSGAIR